MKDKKRKIVLLKSINENMNAVVVNQEIIYSRLEAIIKKMDKLEKDHNVIIETTSIENKKSPPTETERRAELYNEKESQITPTLSSIHPKTHTPITDIIIHQTDNMFKPGIMYANTLHSVFLPETKYLSIRK